MADAGALRHRQALTVRLTLAAIGRLKDGPEQDLCARYLDRLGRTGPAIGLERLVVAELPEGRSANVAERRRDEARRLAEAIPEKAVVIALDERGRALSSAELAALVGRLRDEGERDLAFVIGGPDGLDDTIRERARLVLGLGRLTWPHQLVRVLLAEQLYRAATILSGHPYHRD